MSGFNRSHLDALFLKLLENNLSDKEIQYLDEQFAADPNLIGAYCEFVKTYMALQTKFSSHVSPADILGTEDRIDRKLWEELAYLEKSAPALDIPEPPEEPAPAASRPRGHRKLPKRSFLPMAAAAAMALLFILIDWLAPIPIQHEVATLADCLDTELYAADTALAKGARLTTGGDGFLLQEGMAKLMFDNGVKAVVEAPAEFRLLSENQVELRSGRFYSTVPPEATGFTVITPSARIIDLGTEFGVEADYGGDTSLHVIKGKTTLVADRASSPVRLDVEAGSARKVTSETRAVFEVPCDRNRFVRDIDSERNVIWRGMAQPANGYMFWNVESGNWADGACWDIGVKPDGSRTIRLNRGPASICTLNTREVPVSSTLRATNGLTLNIEAGGYMGCGWTRFGTSTVTMTGDGTWLLNNNDLYIGYPEARHEECVWTMSDTSTITINEDQDDEEVIYIAQDDAKGTLRLAGSRLTVRCDQFYVGFPKNPGFAPHATLEYAADADGLSTIRVGYRTHLSTGSATAHLVLHANETPPNRDLVLISNAGREPLAGSGAFDTMNGGPAAEGTPVNLGGNVYALTYRYDADGDGNQNDIALVYQNK